MKPTMFTMNRTAVEWEMIAMRTMSIIRFHHSNESPISVLLQSINGDPSANVVGEVLLELFTTFHARIDLDLQTFTFRYSCRKMSGTRVEKLLRLKLFCQKH